MKYFLLSSFILQSLLFSAQITITTSDLPQADDVLVTQAATLLQEVDLEQSGEDQTWYFGDEILQSLEQNTEVNCVDVDGTPFAYQFLFNNPFDPEHNSDFAFGVESFEVGTLTFEDAYQYYQNNSQHYAMTGMGVSISGIPLAAVANDVDMIYQLPLEYTGTNTSNTEMQFEIPTLGFWGLTQIRTYEVDGWGVLVINDLNIDVLRYRSVINATDSIFSEAFGLGFNFPRPETIEYKWLSPDYNVPVLQINTSGGFVTSVQTAEIFEVGVEEIESNFSIYPNPANDFIVLSNESASAEIIVTDMQGRTVHSSNTYGTSKLDVSDFANGVYCIALVSNAGTTTQMFVKE